MTHTPTPWMGHVETVLREGGVHPDKRALIVRAVNHHEKLVSLLERAIYGLPENASLVRDARAILDKVRA